MTARDPAPCTDGPAFPGTPSGKRTYAPAAGRRYEVRLSDAQLEAWRAIAARQGVSVADLVRVAVELAGELPRGSVRARLDRAEADRAAAALESFLTRANERTCGQAEEPPP